MLAEIPERRAAPSALCAVVQHFEFWYPALCLANDSVRNYTLERDFVQVLLRDDLCVNDDFLPVAAEQSARKLLQWLRDPLRDSSSEHFLYCGPVFIGQISHERDFFPLVLDSFALAHHFEQPFALDAAFAQCAVVTDRGVELYPAEKYYEVCDAVYVSDDALSSSECGEENCFVRAEKLRVQGARDTLVEQPRDAKLRSDAQPCFQLRFLSRPKNGAAAQSSSAEWKLFAERDSLITAVLLCNLSESALQAFDRTELSSFERCFRELVRAFAEKTDKSFVYRFVVFVRTSSCAGDAKPRAIRVEQWTDANSSPFSGVDDIFSTVRPDSPVVLQRCPLA